MLTKTARGSDGRVASGTSLAHALVWSRPRQPAVSLPADGSLNGVAFSPDGRLVASADINGTVQRWEAVPFADPYAALCADAGPPTRQDWDQYARGEPQPKVCP